MQTGDVVRQKTGGPDMTVEKVIPFRDPVHKIEWMQVACVWFEGAAQKRKVFDEGALEIAQKKATYKFRSKVVEIEAFQLTEFALCHYEDWPRWAREAAKKGVIESRVVGTVRRSDEHVLEVHTLEGDMAANVDDWIIRVTEGELYPCKPSVFERKYEPA